MVTQNQLFEAFLTNILEDITSDISEDKRQSLISQQRDVIEMINLGYGNLDIESLEILNHIDSYLIKHLTTGPKGETGDTGEQGLKGETGSIGLTGDIGEIGIRGIRGQTGKTGDIGLTGDEGEIGKTGIQGIKGQIGNTGNTGLTGDKGEIGNTGIQGIKGDLGTSEDYIFLTKLSFSKTIYTQLPIPKGYTKVRIDFSLAALNRLLAKLLYALALYREF